MAFNFNWSPLTTTSASSSAFYDHAKSLLTAALNKSAKPPIIVDDIFVDDLNLGASAPDLEILEIGDIAEDRFRGIFRMGYDGDAFLTLRTKVQVGLLVVLEPAKCGALRHEQANPLNTYLSTTPAFTSPDPLAASSPLTIPVQITLSQFKLSGFVILVFSKAKGITLVFRNDPLESLKVSSTFDSIPFIAEYLQEEIERQIRRIFQEDLPVAVHRLSLRLWNPEYAASLNEESTAPAKPLRLDSEDEEDEGDEKEQVVNPLLTPADNPEGGPSTMFSERNLATLSQLVDSQMTLSLVTPRIPDAVFRAWASGGSHSVTMWDKPGIVDQTMTPKAAFDSDAAETQSIAGSVASSRLGLYSSASSTSTAPSRHPAGTPSRRKKKHHVVDLRKNKKEGESSADSSASSTTGESPAPPANTPESAIEDELCERPTAPLRRSREDSIDYDSDSKATIGRPNTPSTPTIPIDLCPASPADSIATADITYPPTRNPTPTPTRAPAAPRRSTISAIMEKEALRAQENQTPPKIRLPSNAPGGILEQAILSKIVNEMQRRLEEERVKRGEGKWGVERELEELCGDGLPAYKAAA
jgi:distribution and morphology protein 34